jgi:peptide/nickel transport system substrate-binding protein
MKRRDVLRTAAALGATASLSPPAVFAQSARERTLRVAPLTALSSVDTVFNTSLVTTNHGYAAYDTLFGFTGKREITPQMAEGHTVENDGRTYVIKLREGLKFHNGEPVRAQDAIQSLKRWAGRETFGQTVAKFVDDWGVADDRTLRIKLTQPVPIFLEAIARGSASIPFIIPEHIAKTDPFTQVTDATGSGPYRFVKEEFVPGQLAVYVRNKDYIPASGPADWTSGAKIAHFERLEWQALPEQATAAAALRSGQIDWYEQVQPDLVPSLRAHREIRIGNANPTGFNGILRFNHLQAPFNNQAIRRAVLLAVNQQDYMQALTGGDPTSYVNCRSMFPCGTPHGADTALQHMPADLSRAREALRAAGYDGAKVVVLSPADVPTIHPMGEVTADLLKRLGMNVEFAAMDWATLVARRANREATDKGGWSIFHTWAASSILGSPVEHFPMRGLGAKGWAGWFGDERIEALTADWTTAATDAARAAAADAIQQRAFETVPFIHCGQFQIRTAYRRSLTGMVEGGAAFMWNLRRV